MIFAVLIMQFVVGIVFILTLFAFLRRKRLKVVQKFRTFEVRTLEDDRVFSVLPLAKRITAVRAEIFGLAFASDAMGNAQGIADFAPDLRSFFAVVQVKITSGSTAFFTSAVSRRSLSALTAFDRSNILAVSDSELMFQLLPVEFRLNVFEWGFRQWRNHIDPKITVVRRFFIRLELNVVTFFVENFEEDSDSGMKFVKRKTAAEPFNKF